MALRGLHWAELIEFVELVKKEMWMNKLDWLKWLNWEIGWDDCMDWIGLNGCNDLIVVIAQLVEMIA